MSQRLIRTAPRRPEDCPRPAEPDAWKSGPPRGVGPFEDPHEAIKWAEWLRVYTEMLRLQAAHALLREGVPLATVAAEANLLSEDLLDYVDRQDWTRARLEYSTAYYALHPGRIQDEWYPVEEGDPQLPEGGGFSVRTRTEPAS